MWSFTLQTHTSFSSHATALRLKPSHKTTLTSSVFFLLRYQTRFGSFLITKLGAFGFQIDLAMNSIKPDLRGFIAAERELNAALSGNL